MPTTAISEVRADESGFYGREYWYSHQEEDLGFANIETRARLDLPERCLQWLRVFLKYKLPPGRALELGCAHGGFVSLLRWTGFDASGLELSPWVVDFARRTFDIPVLTGTVEQQQIAPQSLDAIIMMDVLEHVPDPMATIRHCRGLLKEDGIFVIQTPCYPNEKTFEEMLTVGDRFTEMLKAEEHLFLFSRRSIRELFQRTGVPYLEFQPAMFSHYDMFLVASRQPLRVWTPEERWTILASRPSGRLVHALIDLSHQLTDLSNKYLESENDRAARLRVIEDQGRHMIEMDAALTEVRRTRARQTESQVRAESARQEVIEEQTRQIQEFERMLADLRQSAVRQAEAETDRAVRLEAIARQQAQLFQQSQALEESHAAFRTLQDTLNQQQSLIVSLHEKAAKQQQDLQEHLANLASAKTELDKSFSSMEALRSQLQRRRLLLSRLGRSLVYRAMRMAGQWSWLQIDAQAHLSQRLKRIVVDMTPVLPGGENGGAKVMTLELTRQLATLMPECEFILLTAERSHDELQGLEAVNVRRLCVDKTAGSGMRARSRWRESAERFLPASVMRRLRRPYEILSSRFAGSVIHGLGADMLFCPFTAPFFFAPGVPVVCVVYDLQHAEYPQFFSSREIEEREANFRKACRVANKLVCISNHVRSTVLAKTGLATERVTAIPIRVQNRLPPSSREESERALNRHGLKSGRFLLYPANFWPHKNHEILLTAAGIYFAAAPGSDLKVVLPGSPGPRMEELRQASEKMGLAMRVVFPGYLPEQEFAALLGSCLALIFPSLYEGFGMPVLEAMALGKPVLCSKVTSLPEVAGDAAIFFDPKKPLEIAAAIKRIESDPGGAQILAEKGRRHAAAFGGPRRMATEYLRVFREVVGANDAHSTGIHGIYPDGWTSGSVIITYEDGGGPRNIQLELYAPEWIPADSLCVSLTSHTNGRSLKRTLARGQRVVLERELPVVGGYLELVCDPVFQPKAFGIGEDTRFLACSFSPGGSCRQMANLRR